MQTEQRWIKRKHFYIQDKYILPMLNNTIPVEILNEKMKQLREKQSLTEP